MSRAALAGPKMPAIPVIAAEKNSAFVLGSALAAGDILPVTLAFVPEPAWSGR